ncbi:MAG TPA: ATP-dependent Clp protease adapter ClpS [Pseudobdellovibrionaceae bacterium]|nr:ATP-dependent Clp protease adapter ClpS [Pseudobdellovibrionaceae bacterium]
MSTQIFALNFNTTKAEATDLEVPLSHSASVPFLAQASASGSDSGGSGSDTATIAETEDKIEIATPKMYRVLLMNDDFTPMDFVIHVLQKFFLKPTEEATRIMLEVHTKGAGQCGTFTHEIAETKVHLVNTYAVQHRFPLKCIMEKAD